MDKPLEIRLSGSGGQGLILVSIILAEAVVDEGKYVAQSQSYGPEARGGSSRAELIISPSYIDYPLVQKPNILLALTDEALEKYSYSVREDGMIIVDENISGKVHRVVIKRFPIFKTARDVIKNDITANMICLGILNRLSVPVKSSLLEKRILSRVPPHTADSNLKAFHAGQNMVE